MNYGISKPNIENLIKLADYFHCSTDYLLERTTIPDVVKEIDFKDETISKIITQYNALPIEKQQQLLSYLEFLYNSI